jgi:hypothetical protein
MDDYPPTPEQIRDYIAAWKLTRDQVAELLNCNPRTVSFWKSGKVTMPYSVWFTLRSKLEGVSPE